MIWIGISILHLAALFSVFSGTSLCRFLKGCNKLQFSAFSQPESGECNMNTLAGSEANSMSCDQGSVSDNEAKEKITDFFYVML